MDLAAELAARGMSVNVYIRADSVHITLIKPNGNWAAKSVIPHWGTNHEFVAIEAEIEKLLEGCNEHN